MPAYNSHVQRMSTGSTSERGAGLDRLRSLLDDLSEEQLLEVVREPGLLAALNLFLSGDRSLAALNVLYALMGRDSDPNSLTLMLCDAAIFYSPCFPKLKEIAASSSSTLEVRREAWEAIKGVSRMEEGRSFFDSSGMFALLQAGLKSADHAIAKNAAIAVSNLCFDKTIASAIFDGHSDLVETLTDAFCSNGASGQFQCKPQLNSFYGSSLSILSNS